MAYQIYNIHLCNGEVIRILEDYDLPVEDGLIGEFEKSPDDKLMVFGDMAGEIHYVPKNTTVYNALHWGAIDEELTKDVLFNEDGSFDLTVSADKCGTLLERFAYSLKYMHELEQRPEGFEDEMLRELYDAAEFANMDIAKQTKYETYMRTELDIIAEKAYARDEGRAEGRAEGLAEGHEALLETARRMLAEGLSVEMAAKCTGLSREDIAGL